MKDNKTYIIFIILLVLIVTFIIIIFNKDKDDYIYLESEIPVINIDNASSANQTIKNLYNDNKNIVNHEIYTNTDVYSLVLDIDYYSSDTGETLKSYVAYNISLTSEEILTKEELLDKFNISKNDVISSARKLLKQYYDEEVKEGYIEKNECSFEDYIFYIREIEDIYENTVLFVKNNELYGYIPFYKNSLFDDSDYFLDKEDLFKFKI